MNMWQGLRELKIGERSYEKVDPGVFEVPLTALGDFHICDIPPHESIHILGLPASPKEYEFHISVTNGGDEGDFEFLDVFGFVGCDSSDQRESKMRRIRRAYLPFVERGLLPDPLIMPRNAGTGAGFTINCADRPQTAIRDAIQPLLDLFQKLRRPEARLFVCHASEDKAVAKELAAYLSSQGAEVWLDAWEIRVGDSIVSKVNEGLEAASHLGILLSKNSVTKPWVRRELSSALMRQISNNEVTILPIRLDDSPLPAVLVDIRYADCRTNRQAGFQEVVDSLFPTTTLGGGG